MLSTPAVFPKLQLLANSQKRKTYFTQIDPSRNVSISPSEVSPIFAEYPRDVAVFYYETLDCPLFPLSRKSLSTVTPEQTLPLSESSLSVSGPTLSLRQTTLNVVGE